MFSVQERLSTSPPVHFSVRFLPLLRWYPCSSVASQTEFSWDYYDGPRILTIPENVIHQILSLVSEMVPRRDFCNYRLVTRMFDHLISVIIAELFEACQRSIISWCRVERYRLATVRSDAVVTKQSTQLRAQVVCGTAVSLNDKIGERDVEEQPVDDPNHWICMEYTFPQTDADMAQINADMAQADAYMAQADADMAQADADMAQIDAVMAQIDADMKCICQLIAKNSILGALENIPINCLPVSLMTRLVMGVATIHPALLARLEDGFEAIQTHWDSLVDTGLVDELMEVFGVYEKWYMSELEQVHADRFGELPIISFIQPPVVRNPWLCQRLLHLVDKGVDEEFEN